jgi:hypothetical protein
MSNCKKPFSSRTVSNKFGSWSNALIDANIPLNVNLIVIKDNSNRFTEKYGYEILLKIYNHIHKFHFKNVLDIIKYK